MMNILLVAICCIVFLFSSCDAAGLCIQDAEKIPWGCVPHDLWKVSEDGIKSAPNCDFAGDAFVLLEKISSAKSLDCGKSCLANTKCTHFTWNGNACLLKNNPRSFFREPAIEMGAACGSISDRADTLWGGK